MRSLDNFRTSSSFEYKFSSFILLIFFGFTLFSCTKDPVAPPAQEEHDPPTTIILTMTKLDNSGNPTSEKTTCTVRDTTIVKGKLPVEGTILLKSGGTYSAVFSLLDESKTPSTDITNEIIAEKDYHRFVLTLKDNLPSKMTISDISKDSKGAEFGLEFKVNVALTAQPVSGLLNVVLRHYDDGNKSGAQFDTDINRDFSVNIQ